MGDQKGEAPNASAPKVTMSTAWEGWAESPQGHSGDTHSTWVPANPLPYPLFFCLISLAWCTPCWLQGEQPGLFSPSPRPPNVLVLVLGFCFPKCFSLISLKTSLGFFLSGKLISPFVGESN